MKQEYTDYMIMLLRTSAVLRGATPVDIQRNVNRLSGIEDDPPPEDTIACEFCGHEFDEGCGRYGCPNCLGEGLDKSS